MGIVSILLSSTRLLMKDEKENSPREFQERKIETSKIIMKLKPTVGKRRER